MRWWMTALICGSCVGVVSAPAWGQAAPQPPPVPPGPVSADPAATSASYGDWTLRCQRVGEGAAVRRVCEVSQAIRVQDARDPIAEVAFGRLPVEKVLHLTVLLPPNISFPSAVEVSAGEKTPASVELQWRRCLPGGCFADAAAGDDLVKTWRAQTGAGKVTFKDAGGRDIGLPLSFRGLAQALDALDKS